MTFIFFSCSSDEDPEESTLVSSELITTNEVSGFRLLLQLAGISLDADNWRYDVELFKVDYKTLVEGSEVTASALVVVPQTDESVGLISFHRGTITENDEAPSQLKTTDLFVSFYSGLASLGLVAVFPDMIGFGTSLEMVHPYYVKNITASTVRDAIIAAAELAEDRGLSLNGNLFLAGYSQGGYITMAAQQSIEENSIRGFNLKASFPAAGAYDVKGLQEYFFTLDTYEQPYYLAYVGLAYQEYQSLDLGLEDIFNDPYAGRIPGLFDGTLSNSEINDQLTHKIDELLTSEFLEGLETEEKYARLNSLLSENGLLDWRPTVPTFLYHGNADTFIPVQNSIDTYNRLLSNGANEEILSLTIFEDVDHGGGAIPYAEDLARRVVELIGEQ